MLAVSYTILKTILIYKCVEIAEIAGISLGAIFNGKYFDNLSLYYRSTPYILRGNDLFYSKFQLFSSKLD